jgi:hypothetical protein
MGQAEREWLGPGAVERLSVSRRKLGWGAEGSVFLGRLKFKGKEPLAVAVKRFHYGLSKRKVNTYRRAIAKLRTEGVEMPKTDYVFHKGCWVQVSEVFKKGKRTKLKYIGNGAKHRFEGPNRTAALRSVAGVLNAGFASPYPGFSVVYTRRGPVLKVGDLSSLLGEGQDKQFHARELLKHMVPERERQAAAEELAGMLRNRRLAATLRKPERKFIFVRGYARS